VSVVIAHMGPRRHDLWESKAGFEGEFDGLPAGVRVVDLYTRESVCVVDGKRTCILTTHVRSDREATDDEITSGVSLPWSRDKWMSMA